VRVSVWCLYVCMYKIGRQKKQKQKNKLVYLDLLFTYGKLKIYIVSA